MESFRTLGNDREASSILLQCICEDRLKVSTYMKGRSSAACLRYVEFGCGEGNEAAVFS